MTGMPPLALHPARVREQIAELEHEQKVEQGVVETIADLLDSHERILRSIDRRLADLRAHPAVAAALDEQQVEHAAGVRYRHPGAEWTWAESIAGGTVIKVGGARVMELCRDEVSGRLFVAPAGTPPPEGDGWVIGRLVLRGDS